MTGRVVATWLPLFASWLLMTAEGPLLSAVVNRLPDEVVMLAALGIAFAVAVTIESPIINLLSTSTALVRDRATYLLVRRFTIHWVVLLAAVGLLVGFGPLFDPVVRGLLAAPPEIARWVEPGLQILALWPSGIAWRRFLQGVLIRWGQARAIARGTLLRLIATTGTGVSLAVFGELPGIHVAAWALLVGVWVEAAYVTWVARPVIAALPEDVGRALDYRQLFVFHLPLATTAMLTLMTQPMVTFTLARLENPEENLAAWPLVFYGLLVLRAASLALPEVVIALADEDGAEDALRRFTVVASALLLVGMVVVVVTPMLDLYLIDLQDATPPVAAIAALGLALCLPLPAVAMIVSWLQGRLIARGETSAVNTSTVVQLVVLAVGLVGGLALDAPGMAAAVIAMQLALVAQGMYMVRRVRSTGVLVSRSGDVE